MITITLHDNTHGDEIDRDRIARLAARTDFGNISQVWGALADVIGDGYTVYGKPWNLRPKYMTLRCGDHAGVEIEFLHGETLVLTAENMAKELTFEQFAAKVKLDTIPKEQLLRALLKASEMLNMECGGAEFWADGTTPTQQTAAEYLNKVVQEE